MCPVTKASRRPIPLPAGLNELRRQPRRFRLTLVVAGAGVVLSLAAFGVSWKFEQRRVEQALELRADWRASDLQSKLDNFGDATRATAVFVDVTERLSREAFERFARDTVAVTDVAPRSIFWAPLVRAGERAEFERQTAAELGGTGRILERRSEGAIVEASSRDELLPSLYFVSFEGIEPPPILDLWTLTGASREAIMRARDSGRPAGSLPYEFATPARREMGLLLMVPLYRGGGVPATASERQARFRGVVGSSFTLKRVLDQAIADTPPIRSAIYFFGRPPELAGASESFAAYQPTAGFSTGTASILADDLSGVSFVKPIRVFGEPWHLLFVYPAAEAAALRSVAPWLWFACGWILTIAVSGSLFLQQRKAARLSEMLGQREGDIARLTEDLQARAASLEGLFQASPMAIVALGPDGEIRLWSHAAERIFGYSAAEVGGQRLTDIVNDEQSRGQIEAMLRGSAGPGGEGQSRRKDGAPLEIRISGAAVRDAAGRPAGGILLVEDVTHEKDRARQLQRGQRMEAVGQLTGGLAHDFNNLLGVIIGSLDLLSEHLDAGDKDRRKLVDAALTAALKGAELTRSLLAFSRRQPLQATDVDLTHAVNGMIDLLRRTLGEHISIVVHMSPNLPPVSIDAAQFEAALLNLCVNARDAMPDGGTLTIEITAAHLDEEYASYNVDARPGDYVLLSVSDTGTGMAPDVLARAFEPFFTTKREHRGTGLGLSLVYGFVKQSGGHIKLYSEPGHGTTAKIYLPPAVPSARPLPQSAPERGRPVAKAQEVVLVVDDNAAMRDVVVRQLQELGYATLEAENGRQALDLLLGPGRIDLLFTDIVMPGGISGYQLAEAAIMERSTLKVLFTSGFAEAAEFSSGKLGARFALLSKPYRRQDLAEKIREILDRTADGR